MYPHWNSYNPYQYPNFLAPNFSGEFPAALTYNGRLFARRDNTQPILPAYGTPAIPRPEPMPQHNHTVNNTGSETTTGSPLNASRYQPVPPSQDERPAPYRVSANPATIDQQPAAHNGSYQQQRFPTWGRLQPPFHASLHHMSMPNLIQHGQVSFLPSQPNVSAPVQPPFMATQYNPPIRNDGNQGYPPFLGIDSAAAGFGHSCGRCGRLRSARYHREHPLQIGQQASHDVCGRCKKSLAHRNKSEDESSESQHSTKRDAPKHSKRRHRYSKPSKPSLRERSLGRSGRRRKHDHDNHTQKNTRSTSSGEDRGRLVSRFWRRRSPSVEVVRIIETPSQYVKPRKTVYVESISCDESSPRHQHFHRASYSGTPRVISRVGTPTHTVHREQSIPTIRSSASSGPLDYFHGFPDYAAYQACARTPEDSSRADSRISSRQSKTKYRSHPGDRPIDARYSHEDRDDHCKRSRGHNVQSNNVYDGEVSDGVVEVHEVWSRTPSPPPLPPCLSIGRHDIPRPFRIDINGRHNQHGRGSDKADKHVAAMADEPGKVKGNDRRIVPKDDYDWYDENGMRVRVREI